VDAVVEEFVGVFHCDQFLQAIDGIPEAVERAKKEVTDEFYEEYVRVVFGEEDYDGPSLVQDGIEAPPEATPEQTRLFAVSLGNRLVFVKFLEDRGLVDPALLDDVLDAHRKIREATAGTPADAPTLYKNFLKDLFYGRRLISR